MKKFFNTIFIVDDDPVDRRVLRRSLGKIGIESSVLEAVDGLEAYQMLQEQPSLELSDLNRVLAIVDINMGGMNGLDLLEKIKGNPELKCIPVIILSTSDLQEDIDRACDLGAFGYLVKGESFSKELKTILEKAGTFTKR